MGVSKDTVDNKTADEDTADKYSADNNVDAAEAPLIDHLTELRTRLLIPSGSFSLHLSFVWPLPRKYSPSCWCLMSAPLAWARARNWK